MKEKINTKQTAVISKLHSDIKRLLKVCRAYEKDSDRSINALSNANRNYEELKHYTKKLKRSKDNLVIMVFILFCTIILSIALLAIK